MTSPAPRRAVIALGANIGDRWQNISRAIQLLEATPDVLRVLPSPVFETAPVGDVEQPPFLNLVAGVITTLSPEFLMRRLLQIEEELGRQRDVRWGPRTIDLDLLFHENEERDAPGLTLPHPRWSERTFVTIPLRAFLAKAPEFAGEPWQTIRDQLRSIPDDPDVRRWRPSL